MTFKIGQETLVPISNIKNKDVEQKAEQFDNVVKDGVLNMEEASAFVDSTSGQQPLAIGQVYDQGGGRANDVNLLGDNYWQTIGGVGAYNSKGNFHIDGLGAGHINTGRSTDYVNGKSQDVYAFSVNCDLMNKGFLDNNIASATLMVGPKDFPTDPTTGLASEVAIPLNIATQDSQTVTQYNRGGGGGTVTIPEQKMLGARVDVDSLRQLAGTSGGLSFYVRIDTNDGKTFYVNKDGQSGNNFQIDANELQPSGQP